MRRHLRDYPLGPRHLPGTSRRLRKRQGKCRGTRAACANAKANAAEPRAGCANAKANAAELARPAQTPKQMPRNSRRLRKRQSKCRGTRAGCANVKANAAELARSAQTPKQIPRDSRRLRKRQGKCCETCAGCANVKANAAGTPSRLRGQTRINPAPRAARGGGAARRPCGYSPAGCGRARAAAGCRGRKNAGRGCQTCRPARRP